MLIKSNFCLSLAITHKNGCKVSDFPTIGKIFTNIFHVLTRKARRMQR
jgi:hypothetical protein